MIVNIFGTKISYDIYGVGKPLICIHGWLETKRVFRCSSYKSFLIDYKVIALDLPGFGGSAETNKINFQEIIKLIDGLAQELKVENFTILGQCMGSAFALDYAIKYPAKVEKIILVEPMIYLPWWFRSLLIPRVNKFFVKAFLEYKILSGLLNKYRPIRGFKRNIRRMKSLQRVNITCALQYVKLLENYSKYNHKERIKKITVPVTIVNGGKTFRQVKKTIRLLKTVISDVKQQEEKDKNHFIFLPYIK